MSVTQAVNSEMRVSVGCIAMYCQCGSTLVQRTIKGVRTVECYNPKCERVGKLYMVPSFVCEEITETIAEAAE
jgi:hypothetical protein